MARAEAFRHVSVLLSEVVALLQPRPGALFVDLTLGGGGHSEAFLEAGARVIGVDRDPRAIEAASQRLARFGDRFTAICAPFSTALHQLPPADGLLADLGVSSPQLDTASRGFSFQQDGPLDMRMGSTGETAAELIDRLDEEQLLRILIDYGEVRRPYRVARAVVTGRPFHSTLQLADAVARAVGRTGRIHPATLTFQALRIAVNDELGELEALLEALPGLLAPGGRAGIISFHSLEDRLVKRRLRELAGLDLPKDAYGHPVGQAPAVLLTRKAISAGADDPNPRARSARLRGIQMKQQQ